MKVDPRFLTTEGAEIFNGNELLLKGALEAEGGVHLLGGYPGSPTSGFFDAMRRIGKLLREKGIYALINSNEALAAAMINGAQTIGCSAIINMKSVGVHVAADGLAVGNLAGAHRDGGAVICYGDDPWSDSTQVPADSRYLSKHMFIPVVEPANSQEVKDFVDLALKLSRKSELFIGFLLPTNLADGGGSVQCKPNHYPAVNTRQKTILETKELDLDKRIMLPPRTWWQEESFADRLGRAKTAARELGLNRIDYASETKKPIGFVSSGMSHGYLVHALWDMGLLGEFPILKLGMSYPMDESLVRELASQCDRIVVVEERRGFMEEQIAEALIAQKQAGHIALDVELWGKRFPADLPGIPSTRGLHPSILVERLAPLMKELSETCQVAGIDLDQAEAENRNLAVTSNVEVGRIAPRTPTFCPGCPHRDSSGLCLEIKRDLADPDYMRHKHKSKAVDLLFHGDCGCYTMLLFPPTDPLMHDFAGMGLGGGTGVATDKLIENKEVVFMGDSTFFHSGQLAISQAVNLDQDITFIILDNATTAMTGHQPTPGVEYDIIGNSTPLQDIEEVVTGLAGSSSLTVVRVDPERRKPYRKLLEETFLADGVKVIIADKECAITKMRRQRRLDKQLTKTHGYLPSYQHMNINTEACVFCMACAEDAACPGLKHVETNYGMKMDTDITWCVADGACSRIGACSSFERVTIKRRNRSRSKVPELSLDKIPEPQRRDAGDLWRCCLTGVGGMGLGVGTSILVRAGHMEGYDVTFLDKKGLAIRNGGTVSQVAYRIAGQPVTALIPYGKADLLLGIDILEAARALDPKGRTRIAAKDRTAAVINTGKTDTICGLIGRDEFDVDELEKVIRAQTREDDCSARNISRICEKYLGSKLYANIMMIGFAFQKGLIPVSMHSIAWAIKDTISTDFRKNLYAFNMGRKLVVQPDLFQGPPQRTDWQDELEECCRNTIRRHPAHQQLANQLRELTTGTVASLDELDANLKRDIVVRLYDCMRWGGIEYAKRYAAGILDIYIKDSSTRLWAATRAVVSNLADAMLIKDGVYLAELATSPEKYARDREKYNVNRANGDRIVYSHLWNFKVRLWPLPIRFKCSLALGNKLLRRLRNHRWLRKALPGWHGKRYEYLKLYEQHMADFADGSTEQYNQHLRALSSGECLECFNPMCSQRGCPLETDVPQWINLAAQGRLQDAAEKLLAKNNFPEFTSRLCPAMCQGSCKQRFGGYPVQIRQTESQIIDHAFAQGWITPEVPAAKTSRRVAVIGSGPAGLACAQQLVRAGHDVEVFEADDKPGGLLRYGIPDHRLEKNLIDRRLDQLRLEGVTFRTNTRVGEDISATELREKFDAICLSLGARRPRDPNIPGKHTDGVNFAMDFLAQQNRRHDGQQIPSDQLLSAKDKTVVIIGAGETGNDCVEVAHLQGALEIHQLEILPKPSLTDDDPFEPELHAQRQWQVKTVSLASDNGSVSRVNAVQIKWGNTPGGPVLQEVPDSEFAIEADMVIVAAGFDRALDATLIEQLGLTADAQGRIEVHDHATSADGVFSAGDLITGPSYIVTAIDSGRKAARKIDAYLERLPAAQAAPVV